MKTIKKILALSFFLTVITVTTSANSAILKKADCRAYKVLSHEWNMCKLGSEKYPAGSVTEDQITEKKEKKKRNWNFLQKIKNFGGKNIGEAG